jgi:hypothetical protein
MAFRAEAGTTLPVDAAFRERRASAEKIAHESAATKQSNLIFILMSAVPLSCVLFRGRPDSTCKPDFGSFLALEASAPPLVGWRSSVYC